ncbi:MAG TPA: hypothetical protein VFU15_13130 [Bacteroidia bacterium]|nr:hypothetical protein [Bacteroidia bacterium]
MQKTILSAFLLFALASCSNDKSTKVPGDSSVTDTGKVAVSDTAPKDECAIRKKRIPKNYPQDSIDKDLIGLSRCGIDSFDYLYVVPNLFPAWLSERRVVGDTVTYGDFIEHLEKFRTTDSYYKLHLKVATLDSLKTIPFQKKDIYRMKPLLGQLGFTEGEWDMFSGFAVTYPVPDPKHFSWGDMLDAFEKYKSTRPPLPEDQIN